MKVIKYRLWNKKDKKMIYPHQADQGDSFPFLLAIGLHGLPIAIDKDSFSTKEIKGWNVDHAYEILRFTGVRDDKGNEIFEGDILSDSNDYYYVCYDSDVAAFVLSDGHEGFEIMHDWFPNISFFVVGNIYQNFGLLEGGM